MTSGDRQSATPNRFRALLPVIHDDTMHRVRLDDPNDQYIQPELPIAS
jgi:hypothetical protein